MKETCNKSKMERLLKNEDIKRLIFSFGTIEHRVFTKNLKNIFLLLEKIRNKNIQLLLYDFNKQSQHQSIVNFIYTIFSKEKQKDFLKQLNGCYCCNKHRYNRNPYKQYTNDTFSNETCSCYCRHITRHLYRCLEINENCVL